MSARKIEIQLLDNLWRVSGASTREVDGLLQEANECSLAQFQVLRALEAYGDHQGALVATDIARTLGCSKANAGQLVTRLEERGHLKKLTGGADGRYVALRLTARGREMHGSCESQFASDAKRIFKKLDADEKQQLLALLKKLV